ncbi:hypothetical protein [Achromobacter sp. B7]|uniref:hypothetical protein n=1 Tax=Achromobacter sp. B7 TaxID=2282475 RepID=UPI00352DD60E
MGGLVGGLVGGLIGGLVGGFIGRLIGWRVDRKHDFLALQPDAADQAADGNLPLRVAFDGDLVLDAPRAHGAYIQRAGRCGDGVLLFAARLALRVGQGRFRPGLYAQADAGGHGGVVGNFVGNGRARDTGGRAGAFVKHRIAAGQRGGCGKANQGKGKRAARRV